MPSQGPAPLVTGISPNEGVPGTKVKIRGENLGQGETDLISLRIGGAECVLAAQWKTANKIDAIIPAVAGQCSIVVVTKSGGIGSSNVLFNAQTIRTVALNEPCAVWVDESRTFNTTVGNSGRSAPKWLQEETDLLGLPRSSARISLDELNQLFASRATRLPSVAGASRTPNANALMSAGGAATEEVRSTVELGNVHSTSFDATYYLLANHADVTFDELKRGLQHLRTRSTTRLEGTSSYLKTNLQTILDALTAIDTLRVRLGKPNGAGSVPSGRAQLDSSIDQCEIVLGEANRIASTLFADVLERKDRADKNRNALAALQRFKTLFGLADLLDRHVRAGDWHLVVSDYMRARSNFATSNAPLVRRVWNDVEARIDSFKDTLYRKLLTLPATFDEQKRLLRFLLTLDPHSGAIRDCLYNEAKWLCKQIVRHKFEAVQRFEAELRAGSKPPTGGAAKASTQPGSAASAPAGSLSPTNSVTTSRWQVKLSTINVACSFMLDNYPHFMRLGHAYLNGTLLKDLDSAPGADQTTGRSGSTLSSQQNARRDIESDRAAERQRVQSEWNEWNVRVVSAFVYLVRGALVPDSLDPERSNTAFDRLVTEFEDLYVFDWLGAWRSETDDEAARYALLHGAVWPVRRCAKRLVALGDALPGECQTALHRLAYDVRYATLIAALQRAKHEIESLDERETWQLDNIVSIALDDTGNADSTCCVTQLPALFETIVNETFQQAFESVVRARADEAELLNRQVTAHVSALFGEVLFAFHNVLERLALSSQSAGAGSVAPATSYASDKDDAAGNSLPAVPLSSALALKSLGVPPAQAAFDRRVLVVIANCAYTTDSINRRLQANATARFRQLDASRCAKADAAFRKLRDQLMRSYVDQKSDLIIGKMEQQLFVTVGAGGKTPFVLSWPPTGVRRFVKQTLLTLLSIHAELFAVAPCYLAHVLGELFERVFDELHRLYCSGGSWNRNGRLQALLDALFLKSFCAPRYFRGNTHALFDEICNVVATGTGCSDAEKPVSLDRLTADVQPLLTSELRNDQFMLKCLLV